MFYIYWMAGSINLNHDSSQSIELINFANTTRRVNLNLSQLTTLCVLSIEQSPLSRIVLFADLRRKSIASFFFNLSILEEHKRIKDFLLEVLFFSFKEKNFSNTKSYLLNRRLRLAKRIWTHFGHRLKWHQKERAQNSRSKEQARKSVVNRSLCPNRRVLTPKIEERTLLTGNQVTSAK